MQTVRPRRRPGGRRFFPRRKVCQFCVDKITIDYKDVQRMRRFVSEWGKIESRRKTGTCSPHQRQLSTAIKRARFLALLPYTGGHSQMDLGRPDRGAPRGPRPPVREGPPRDYSSSPVAPTTEDRVAALIDAPEPPNELTPVDVPTADADLPPDDPEPAATENLAAHEPATEITVDAETAPAESESAAESEDAAGESDK